jgi:hypothetical protein
MNSGKSKGNREEPSHRASTDEASAEHRRKLEALFGGGKETSGEQPAASEPKRSPSGKVFASPRKSTGRQPSEYRLKLERLRIARAPEDIREATDTFLKSHQLPDDLDILYKVLQHPDEKVLREAMGQISALIMQGRVGGTLILEDRLKDLTERIQEASTKSYVEGLKKQVEQLKTRE